MLPIEITTIRTGAATAVAAKYLSNADSKFLTIIGCGNQGRISLKALMAVREIKKVFAYDIDQSIANAFTISMSKTFNLDVAPVDDFRNALAVSDLCVTCTPLKKHFIDRNHVKPGMFIAAVGSDNEAKQELDPSLLVNKLVVDSLEQASDIGELHHALKAGLVRLEGVHAELGEVIIGKKEGRVSKDEIIIFDTTGTALQDAAAAAVVYEKAIKKGISTTFAFAS